MSIYNYSTSTYKILRLFCCTNKYSNKNNNNLYWLQENVHMNIDKAHTIVFMRPIVTIGTLRRENANSFLGVLCLITFHRSFKKK